MSGKFSSTITGGAVIITFIGIISRGFGFIREIVYAGSFGLQTNFEIYLIGSVFPLSINTAVYYLAQNYFIPSYNRYLHESDSRASDFFNNVFWTFVLSSVVLTLSLFLLTPVIIEAYLKNTPIQLKETASDIYKIFLLTIPFNTAYSVITAYLYAKFDFKSPAISTLFLNIVIIILVIFFDELLGVFSIPVGYLAGTILQFLFLLYIPKIRSESLFRNINFNLGKFERLKQVLFFTILVEVINQIYPLVDRYFYGNVEEGGIAALNFALVVYVFPISVFSLALSTAIFPGLSQLISNKDIDALQNQYVKGIRFNIFIFIPISIIFIFFGDVVIKLLYERGKFTEAGTLLTYDALKIYTLSLIFYTSYAIINKTIYGAGLIKQLLIISLIAFGIKIFLNFYLVGLYEQNGLALSTAVSFTLLSFGGYFLVSSKLKLAGSKTLLVVLLFYTLNGFLSLLQVKILFSFLPYSPYLEIVSILLFISFYSINLFIIKAGEFTHLKNVINRLLINN
jgi:putative peptidoglycan lipid II flippase